MVNISIDELSLTISELVDLDPEQQTLIESAVNRAISAKDIVGGLTTTAPARPIIITGYMLPPEPTPRGPLGPIPLD